MIIPKLKVEKASVEELVPYAGNAKEHTEKQVREIANSIEAFGFNDPVGVWTRPDGQLEIVEGHGRILAAKLLGMEHVPVIRLDHLDDDARRAYVHVHNQTTLSSGFDVSALNVDLADIPGFDWSDFGFDVVSPDCFGTDFELSDSDGPIFHTITMTLDDDQFEIVQAAIDESDADGGGNHAANAIAKVVREWRAAQTSTCE